MTRIALAGLLLATMGLVPSSGRQAHEPQARAIAPDDVAERVLRVIRELQTECADVWHHLAAFEKWVLAPGLSPRVVGVVPNLCASASPITPQYFDTERARRYARELFACYDLPLEANILLANPEVMIDGWNAEHGLGFVLREPPGPPGPELGASHAIDPQRVPELAAAGIRIQLSDPQTTQQGNQFIQILAYLATLVEFLNEHTSGPDVDLSPALWRVQQQFEADASIPREGGFLKFVAPATEPRTVALRFGESGARVCVREPRIRKPAKQDPSSVLTSWMPRSRPISTAGTISVVAPVTMQVQRSGKLFPWRLVQQLADGTELRIESQSFVIFTPPVFDAARPFQIEIAIEAGGQCTMSDDVWGRWSRATLSTLA